MCDTSQDLCNTGQDMVKLSWRGGRLDDPELAKLFDGTLLELLSQ